MRDHAREYPSTEEGPRRHVTRGTSRRSGGLMRLLMLALLVALASLGVVLFGSPLFQTLSFEYSALSALILSLAAGIDSALSSLPKRFAVGLWRALTRGAVLWLVPLAISLLSLLWLDNCALEDGIQFYLEIALPTALLATGFGYGFRLFFGERRYGVIAFLLFWVVTLVLSLLPGYSNAQLFTYGWQYGYFPGLVWDRAMELRPAYLAFRIENVVWLLLLLAVVYDLFYRENARTRFVLAGLLVLATVAIVGSHDNLGITATQSEVREVLRREAYLGNRTWLYYERGSLTDQEIARLQHDVPIYLTSIQTAYDLRPTGEPIHIYLYPDAATMERFLGTRAASIAKPWLGEVHIMKPALASLKHELTHVLLRTIGSIPFYASWSTGLTEGAAVAMESPNGAFYTDDQVSAQLLEARMTSGVAGIMQFTGFASENSQKSYTLAGSFVKYLLDTYGARRFREVYGSLDYDHVYGRSIDQLEHEWESALIKKHVPLDSNDLARLRYEFGSPPIIMMPCVRRLGKLERTATVALEHDNYGDAYRASEEAVQEGGGPGDAWTAAWSLVMLGRLEEARTLLDTVNASSLSLALVRAELAFVAGDRLPADSLYRIVTAHRLSTSSFFTAYDRQQMLGSDIAPLFAQYLLVAYRSVKPNYHRLLPMLDTMLARHTRTPGFDRVEMSLLYIKLHLLEDMGWPQQAAQYDPIRVISIAPGDSITSDDLLALSIIERHMWRYRPPSWAKPFIPERYQEAAEADEREAALMLPRE